MDDKGAGVMAAFGLPPSHDNDPERAVLASMDFCRKIDEVIRTNECSWAALLMSSQDPLSRWSQQCSCRQGAFEGAQARHHTTQQLLDHLLRVRVRVRVSGQGQWSGAVVSG